MWLSSYDKKVLQYWSLDVLVVVAVEYDPRDVVVARDQGFGLHGQLMHQVVAFFTLFKVFRKLLL